MILWNLAYDFFLLYIGPYIIISINHKLILHCRNHQSQSSLFSPVALSSLEFIIPHSLTATPRLLSLLFFPFRSAVFKMKDIIKCGDFKFSNPRTVILIITNLSMAPHHELGRIWWQLQWTLLSTSALAAEQWSGQDGGWGAAARTRPTCARVRCHVSRVTCHVPRVTWCLAAGGGTGSPPSWCRAAARRGTVGPAVDIDI